jgi:hypothetical protein
MPLPRSLGSLGAAVRAVVGASGALRPRLAGEFGWRCVAIGCDKNDFEYNMAHAGHFIGLGIRC